MLVLETGWGIAIDYSSEWLFFRLESVGSESVRPTLSESIWASAQERGIRRLVCELAELVSLNSYVIGQLVMLHKRAHLEGGVLRLCGFSRANYGVLRMMHLADRFPNFDSREDAVMGRVKSEE
jgi:anti-anti-sigma regulatory factor